MKPLNIQNVIKYVYINNFIIFIIDKYCYFLVSLGILLFLHEIFTCSSPPHRVSGRRLICYIAFTIFYLKEYFIYYYYIYYYYIAPWLQLSIVIYVT